MSEVNTYKKITDVEQIETLNDAATVFINDNGAMKQVAANEFGLGTVKTVNGIEPDENGNIKSDIAVPVLITHLKFPMFDDIKCNKTYEELHHSFLTQSTEATSIALCLYTALDKSEEYRYCTNFVLEKDNGEFTKRYFLYFGEDIAPYIIDVDANTITLDPNWIKPEENVQPDWNQNDETAPDYVKNRTHYNNQFRQVINLDPAKDFYHTTGGYHIGGSGSLDPTEKNNGYAIGDYFLSKQQLAIFPGIVKFDDIVIEFTGPRRLPVTFRLTNNEFPQFQFHQHGSQIGCDILYADNKPHTFEWIDTHFAETVPLDEKYIPATIARKSDLEGLGGPSKYVFINSPLGFMAPYSVDELFAYASDSSAYNKNSFIHRIQNPMNSSEPVQDYHCTNIDTTATKMVLYFGDLVAPIIIDKATNTITLDPDWVKPEENAGGSGGAFVVNLTSQVENDYAFFNPDKTFDETMAALQAGQTVIFRNESADEFGTCEIANVNSYIIDHSIGFGTMKAGLVGYDGDSMRLIVYEFQNMDGCVTRSEKLYPETT